MDSGCEVFVNQSVSLRIHKSCFPQFIKFTGNRLFAKRDLLECELDTKTLDGFTSYVEYLWCIGMTQHKKHLMQLRFQYEENSQKCLIRSYPTKTYPMN